MDEPTPQALRNHLYDIAHEVSDLESKVDKADDRLEALERHRDLELPERLDEIESIAEEARDGLTETLRDIRGMRSHLRWLERVLADTTDLPQARLDETNTIAKGLVARVNRGLTQETKVTPQHELTHLQWLIDRPSTLIDQRDDLIDEAVTLSRELRDMPTEHTDYRARVATFSSLTHKISTAQEAVTKAQEEAKKARQDKHQHESANSALGPEIMEGQRARTQLIGILRKRLSKVITENHRLPEWFTQSLGHLPPRQGVEEWMATAADVIAYRLLRGIDDPVSALGSAPKYGSPLHSDHRDLKRRIAELAQ